MGADAADNRPPEIEPRFAWLWRAFCDLQTERAFVGGGMGPAIPRPIPWSRVEEWADRARLCAVERGTLRRVARALDGIETAHTMKKLKDRA